MSAGWRNDAACAGLDPELWFPESGFDGADTAAEAKAICGDCPVSEECLQHALTLPERFGIWGGHTERERRVLRRRYGYAAPAVGGRKRA